MGNHHIVAVGAKRILAIQDAGVDGKSPAESVLEVELADRAAQSLFEADDGLRRSLYVLGVLEDRPEKPAKVSLGAFKRAYADIAYVIPAPHASEWYLFAKAICTCRVFATQQQCQHLLFAGGLRLQGVEPQDFGSTPQSRAQGRPKSIRKLEI